MRQVRVQILLAAPGTIDLGKAGVELVHEQEAFRGKGIVVREIQRTGRDLDGLAFFVHIGQGQPLGPADDGAGRIDAAEIINEQGAAITVFRKIAAKVLPAGCGQGGNGFLQASRFNGQYAEGLAAGGAARPAGKGCGMQRPDAGDLCLKCGNKLAVVLATGHGQS